MRRTAVLLACIVGVVGISFVATDANATVALCVGCTTNNQFQGAAWQAAGTSFIGDVTVLVVNPSSGQSQWVRLTHYPPGTTIRAIPAQGGSGAAVEPGTAVPVHSDPFMAVYFAGDPVAHPDSAGISRAVSTGVAPEQQATITTVIKVTDKIWFVQLNAAQFPSYEEAQVPAQIAEVNFAALSSAGIGWPVNDESDQWVDDLFKIMKIYRGHSITVCDVFGNGDSVCATPDPADNDVYTQNGPAKNAQGDKLPAIGNRVAGGGGDGMSVTQSPGQLTYYVPGAENIDGVRCGFVDGELSICVLPF